MVLEMQSLRVRGTKGWTRKRRINGVYIYIQNIYIKDKGFWSLAKEQFGRSLLTNASTISAIKSNKKRTKDLWTNKSLKKSTLANNYFLLNYYFFLYDQHVAWAHGKDFKHTLDEYYHIIYIYIYIQINLLQRHCCQHLNVFSP